MKKIALTRSKNLLLALSFILSAIYCSAQVPSAPATCTAAISSLANGAAHYLSISWSTVAAATSYELEYSINGTTWNALYSGTALTYSHNTGSIGNLPYYYHVRTIQSANQSVWKNATQYPIYSACDVPAQPLVTNAQPFSLSVAIQPEQPDTNPAYTTYSIYCTTSSQYVQANGTLGATEVFQTRATWGTLTVTGLTASTNYCFYAKAKNNDGDIRVGTGGTILTAQPFNSNVLVNTNPTTSVWYAPNSNTPLAYNATGGCTGGMIKYSGSFTNYWGNFVRTPHQNCTGNSSVILNFDLSNTYIASHIVANPSSCDGIRFYMWVDNGYKNATSVKIGGTEVSFSNANGRYLKFDALRSCVNVDVTFDLTTCTNLSNILFYIEPSNPYNDNNAYNVVLDNISMLQALPATACLSTTACSAATIQTQPADQSICVGSNTSFTVSVSGGVASYQWQVSMNGGGSWNNVVADAVYSNVSSATLNITGATLAMSGYKYHCNVTGACSGTPVSNTATLTLNTVPDAALGITGSDSVCQGASSQTYSIAAVNGATSYLWSLPAGATIAFGSGTTNITVTYAGNASSGNVQVTPHNSCGNGTASPLLPVAVKSIPSTPASVSGSASVCEGSSQVYAIGPVNGAENYLWTLPNGWSGISSSDSIVSVVGVSGGTISVAANNTCGSSVAQTFTTTVINKPATPAAILGADSVCAGSTVQYSVVAVNGASAYTWVLPAGWVGSSASDSIYVVVDSTLAAISVTADNTCGSSLTKTKTVVGNALPLVDLTLPKTEFCQDASLVTLIGGFPAGGLFSGPGISSGSFDPSTLSAPADYTLNYSFTDLHGCTATDTATVSLVICSGIENTMAGKVYIYPNPFSDLLTIALPQIGRNNTATIYDIAGRSVMTYSLASANNVLTLGNLAPGLYSVGVKEQNKTVMTQKLLKLQ